MTTTPSPWQKALVTVFFALTLLLLAIGVPNSTSVPAPSKNLANLPVNVGSTFVKNCTAGSPSSWVSCVASANMGRVQRIYVNGFIECSANTPCEVELVANKTPVAIQAVTPQSSGFARRGGFEKPLLIIRQGNHVTVSGLVLRDDGASECSSCEAPLIDVESSTRVTLRDLTIQGAKGDGIRLRGVTSGVVQGSVVTGSKGVGLRVVSEGSVQSRSVDLLSNTLEFNQRAGVIFQAQSDSIAPSRIEANLVQQNGEGVLLAPTAHSIALIDNTIQGNRGGQFGGNGVTIQTESLEGAIRIERNQIFKNGGWAIRQEGADCVNATELNNTVRENECGGSGCAGGKEVEVRDCAGPVEKTEPLAPAPPAPTTQTSLPLPPAPQVETPVSSVPTGVETPANPAPITPPSMVMEFASSASTDLAVMAMTPAEPSIVVVNAANYQKQSVAPGSLVAIYYAGSVSGSCSATTLPLPTTLCGMQVRYRFFSPTTGNRDELLPLLYVDKSQINAQIPTNAAISVPGEFATITVQGVGESLDGSLSVRAIAPGLFPGSGGKAKVTRANGEEITERNPVIPGEQLTLWGTGFGATVRDSAGNKKVIVRTNEVGGDEFAIPDVSVRIGGVVAEGVRAFKAPKMVGVDQIVFSAPLTLQQGANQILVCRADSFAGGTVVCTDTDATVTIGPKKPALVRIAPYSSSSFPLRGERALAVGGLATAHHTGLEINTPCLGQAAPVRGESSPRTGANNVAPIVLCGVDLRISSAGTNQAVPLVYVDQNRIDFQIPFEAKSRADFELWFKGVRVGSLTALPVGSGDLSGYPLLLGAVGTEREAAPGQALVPNQRITIRGTGFGQSTPPIATNRVGNIAERFIDLSARLVLPGDGSGERSVDIPSSFVQGFKTGALGIDEIAMTIPPYLFNGSSGRARLEICRKNLQFCSSFSVVLPRVLLWNIIDESGVNLLGTGVNARSCASSSQPGRAIASCLETFTDSIKVAPGLKAKAQCGGSKECEAYSAETYQLVPPEFSFNAVWSPDVSSPPLNATFKATEIPLKKVIRVRVSNQSGVSLSGVPVRLQFTSSKVGPRDVTVATGADGRAVFDVNTIVNTSLREIKEYTVQVPEKQVIGGRTYQVSAYLITRAADDTREWEFKAVEIPGIIKARVVDLKGGPIAGVKVVASGAFEGAGVEAVTDVKGEASILVPLGARYELRLPEQSYSDTTVTPVQGVANGEAYEGAKASVHQFQIRYFGKVCVVVETSSFPKKPIAGVTFKGFPNLRSAKTDAKGGYCIPQRLKPGTAYSFTPEKIGYRFRPTVISGVVSGETPTASQSFLGIASQASSAQSKMKATGR